MNITEANAVNTVLRWVLHGPDGRTGDGHLGVDRDKAQEAAEYLAERAYPALHAGLRATDVHLAWPGNQVDLAAELRDGGGC